MEGDGSVSLKRCNVCGEEKPVTEFPPRGNRKNAVQPYCRACHTKTETNRYYLLRGSDGFKERRKIAAKNRYEAAKRERRCFDCDQTAVPDQVYCAFHAEQRAARERNKRAEAPKLCMRCGIGERAPRRRLCVDCAAGARERFKAYLREYAQKPDQVELRKEYAKSDKSKHLQHAYAHNRRREIQAECYEHYGGSRCACCGETTFEFLSIDHIDGDGAQHRRNIKTYRCFMAGWLKKNGYPDGFRVLCYNCNAGRWRNGGICPHHAQRPNGHLAFT